MSDFPDFDALRKDSSHHLGMGDIRLTIAQQDAVMSHIKELEAKLERITSLSQKWRKEGIPVTGTRLVIIADFDVCDQLDKALKEGNDA